MADTVVRCSTLVGKPDKFSDPLTSFWMYQMASARALLPGAECAAVLARFPHLSDKNFGLSLPLVVQ
jgi:hypothetical protein